jgi:hypothetical protein
MWLFHVLIFILVRKGFGFHLAPHQFDANDKVLQDFIKDFDAYYLLEKFPDFDPVDFADFPIVETTIGEDHITKKCYPDYYLPDFEPLPGSHRHCAHVLDILHSFRRIFQHRGPFLLHHNDVKIIQILENTNCRFIY